MEDQVKYLLELYFLVKIFIFLFDTILYLMSVYCTYKLQWTPLVLDFDEFDLLLY